MEPLDPAKNDEGSGFTKRRISSILKAPQRSSMKFSDPVQQENVVECAKPVEKRNSRRVSFAPANNVLLFSKDGKNASPAKNPLQELITTTAAATKNGVQVAVTEDGIQQITGMETLLNAPLHASQQGQKVNFDTAGDLGEKTVIFSTDDEFMDMTHSHTINIAGNAELLPDISLQNYDPLPSRRAKTEMFTVNNGSMARNVSSSVPSLDPEFEKFLASHSKQSGPSSSPVITRTKPASGAPSEEANRSLAQIKTQRADVDKENQAPTSVSAVVEKSLNTSRKIGELSYGSALCPEDDLSMDTTKAQTDCMLGFADDDDPFQCLFPTQEMYSRFDNRVSQTAEKTKQPQRSSKTLASFNPKDMTSLKNPAVCASHQRHKANLDTEDDCKEKTIMFSAGDEFMNMTQSHTVNIASSLLPPLNQNLDIVQTRGKMANASSLEERKRETCGAPGSTANALDLGFEDFLSSLSKPGASSGNPAIARTVPSAAASSKETVDTNGSLSQLQSNVGKGSQSLITSRIFEKSFNGGTICPENDVSMDMTEAQTGRIIGLTASDDPFQFLFPTQDMYPRCERLKKLEMTSGQKNRKALGSSNRAGLETALKSSLKTKVQRNPVKFDTEDNCREKPERISSNYACMDVTQSHTVNIATGFELQSFQNVDVLPICGEKTFRLTANDTSMDMTKCLTVNIAESVLPAKKQEDETCGLPRSRSSSARGVDPSFNKSLSKPSGPSVNPVVERMTPTAAQYSMGDSSNGGTICPEDDVNVTEAQTGRVLGLTDDTPRCLFPTQDIYPRSGSLKKAPMTSRQQHNETLGTFRKGMDTSSVQRDQVKFDAEDDCREKTVKFTADDACMDITRSHTVNIATDLKLQPHQNLDFSPAFGEKTMRFNTTDAAMDVTRSHTVNIATDFEPQSHQAVDVLPAGGEKTMRFNTTDAAMDVTRSHTVNIATDLKLQPHQYVGILPAGGEKTMRFNTTDAAMDVTRSHTVNIATDLKLQPHQYLGILPACGEKTMRFNTTDAAMDVTRSHTVNIATNFEPQSHQAVGILPAGGEKTMRFNTTDAAMDVTRSHTVNIATDLKLQPQHYVGILPACGEKTMRFNTTDAAMDVTRSHTVNIATDLKLQPHQYVGILPACGEKTMRFNTTDAAMDVTRSHTVNIATDFEPQSHQAVGILPAGGEKTMRFNTTDAAMDVTRSHTVNIATDFEPQSHQDVDVLPAGGEKTMRFNTTDAAMDVTRSHTVNIATDLKLQPHQYVGILPACGEKTMRFNTTDAAMDVTRSHTVNIATDFEPQSHQAVGILPAGGEKTMRFNTTDAAMDVTRSHTVNIATDLKLQPHQNLDFSPAFRERTMRLNTTGAAMDVTRSHTVNIATDFEPQSHQAVDILPAGGEKTMRFADNDAVMDVTQCLALNIASNSVSDSLLPRRDSNIIFTHKDVDFPLSAKKTHRPRGNQSSSARALDPGFKNSLSRKSDPWARAVAPAAPSPQETPDTDGLPDQLKTQKPDVDTEKVALPFVSAVSERPVNKTMTEGPEHDVSMTMTEAQTGGILGQTYTGEAPQCLSSTQDWYPNPDHLKKTEATPQRRNEALGSSNPGRVEIPNLPDSPDSYETGTSQEPKSKNLTSSLSQMVNSPSAVDYDVDTAPSRKSRRMSLADIKSKVRRLSHMVSTAPDAIAVDSHTAPLPHLERDMDKTSSDKTKSLPVTEPQLEMGLVNAEENAQAQCLLQGEQPSATTTPFNLKTKQLMSRLSMGIFKAKLPQKRKPDDPKKGNSVDKHQRTVTVNVTNQLSNFVDDMSDIYNEELDSYEDMSETLDIMSPQKATENVSASQEFDMDELLEKDVSEKDFISPVGVKKRPVPADENNVEDEKRLKVSTDVEMGFQSHVVECDSNATTVPSMTTQTTDYSNSSHTASIRCEATFESTYKQSLFESQLEDYANDVQRKLDDTITLLEFFQLFNIDFVIHNPRQSILPGRLLSDTDRTPMDLLKDRHINRPKQTVYETDVLNLTEMVEGLKERMRDLDKPLKIVNRPLWEEVRNYSEKELKSFGAKLKERHNLFRKLSKVQSHEMKEVLYSNLVQANLKEQQRPRGMIEEADGMIKSLDDCIREIETELIVVEEKGFEDQPSLKSRQEEMQKVTEALEDNNRQISELEMRRKQTSNKLSRLKVETSNLESHVTALHMVNEWKFGEKRDNCSVYTFLYETLILQLVYEKSNGNYADNRSERKISHITLSLQLDDEKSLGNARLVHKLLSQYIEGETDWVEKYPTSRHVPRLLHDVSLVVSRCRLLGEELRRLKTWGSVRLNILNMSCVDTQVHFVFSSLKTFSQFEVIFSVSLIGQPYALQLQSFKNMIGNTTIQQIEEIVSSFSPSKNLLTKIVKKINENLLY